MSPGKKVGSPSTKRKSGAKQKNRASSSSQFNATSYVLVAVIALLVIGGAWFFLGKNGADTTAGPDGSSKQDPAAVSSGKAIYDRLCVSCHGENGIGEKPEDMYALDATGKVVAPPLDGSAHAWHHSDDNLVDTILNGSPQNPRMRAWGDTIEEKEARDLVAYMKSLWAPEILACQGDKHMSPECQALSNTP